VTLQRLVRLVALVVVEVDAKDACGWLVAWLVQRLLGGTPLQRLVRLYGAGRLF
jgi:hypothetical protein